MSDLVKKWENIGLLSSITEQHKKEFVAQLLENQATEIIKNNQETIVMMLFPAVYRTATALYDYCKENNITAVAATLPAFHFDTKTFLARAELTKCRTTFHGSEVVFCGLELEVELTKQLAESMVEHYKTNLTGCAIFLPYILFVPTKLSETDTETTYSYMTRYSKEQYV